MKNHRNNKNLIYLLTIKSVFLFSVLFSKYLFADIIYIGVASNFSEPIKIIKHSFENETDHKLIISKGSSGGLYSQIMNGAPLDIFLSADQNLPLKLEKNKKGIFGTRFTYARGKLKLLSFNKKLLNKMFPRVLTSGHVNYIGIGNPLFVPYGYAAKEVLKTIGLTKKISNKLILGKNVNQVFLMSYLGNLDLAFVSHSDIKSKKNNKKGIIWEISQDFYSPINQDAILLLPGNQKKGAKEFMHFLKSDFIKKKIRDYGYEVD